MADHYFVEVLREGLYLVLLISAPPVLAGLAAGLVMALFQAGTRLTDPALALLPRVAAVFFALALSGPWIGEQLERFSRVLWQGIALIR